MPFYIEKPIGKTPLDMVKLYQTENPGKKYSFAGRLDPMARGTMIILEGDECKQQDIFCQSRKVYEFTILWGCQTDTHDVLGILQKPSCKGNPHLTNPFWNIDRYLGKQIQKYPVYSSMVVQKKPLWLWAKENRLNEITIPGKEIEIFSLTEISPIQKIRGEVLYQQIVEKINTLDESRKEAFRVPEILERWKQEFTDTSARENDYYLQRMEAFVSSGTYIRSLVHQMGQDLGCGALALDIHRTQFIEV